MTKTSGLVAAALFGATMAGAGLAYAQTPPGAAGQPPAHHDMQHTTPMQGGMCGLGGCGMGAPVQSTPMQGMMQQGQGGTMQGG